MNISLLDLKKQYKQIKDKLEPKILNLLSSGNYVMGKTVMDFEKNGADYLEVKHAISVANGTDALIIALKSLGIGEGDEVITTPFTFFATGESIARVGAIPVFVDVYEDTFNIDVSKIEEKITERTKAIMPVHIFGQPAKMDEINQIAQEHNLHVIEDACQAIGAEYKGKKAGSLGDIACFSFFPTKNLGCFGDGGLITTNNDELAKIAKALRNHAGGYDGLEAYNLLNKTLVAFDKEDLKEETMNNYIKYYNYAVAYNSRLDAIQALILTEKLNYLHEWNEKRISNARHYNEKLANVEVKNPKIDENIKMVYHQYVLKSEHKDKLVKYLNDKGISIGVYYPIPLHLQRALGYLGYKEGDFPVAEYLSKRTFALPIYPELKREEQDYVIEKIKEFYTL